VVAMLINHETLQKALLLSNTTISQMMIMDR